MVGAQAHRPRLLLNEADQPLGVGEAVLAEGQDHTLRADIELPPLDAPGFQDAVIDAQATLTADAIAETFLAVAVLAVVYAVLAP